MTDAAVGAQTPAEKRKYRYCLRKKGVRLQRFNTYADLIWVLDEQLRYIRAIYGIPGRGRDWHKYAVRYKDDYGSWRNGPDLNAYDVNVRIRDVVCRYEEQKKAIARDLSDGTIRDLY